MSDDLAANTFNLVRAAWIPVRRRSGAVEHIPPWRINDRIDEDPFVAFAWPRPDFDGAMHEFLIGLLSTAAARRETMTLGKTGGYGRRRRRSSNRNSRRSLMPSISTALAPVFSKTSIRSKARRIRDVAALLIDSPGAQTLRNNADHFVKRGGAPALCRAAAAMALYTLSAYAPAGGAGHRTSLRGGGPMTTLIVASHKDYDNTLWGRLWPNVETKEQIERRATESMLQDDPGSIFPWLVPTRTSNQKAGGRPTTPADIHPLQVYWGMPRRLRLLFEHARGRRCGLTGAEDSAIVASYRTRKHGIDYSDGFEHPLTPYYRQKIENTKLPLHPRPGGISYRLWPGLVVRSNDRLRDPAQAIRHWPERMSHQIETRFAAFGYDMDNMKARDWIESEMPLWLMDDAATRDWLENFIGRATAGAGTVARLLTGAIKSALYDKPADANGDFGFIAERFYRETEAAFFDTLGKAVRSIDENPDSEDPTIQERGRWLAPIKTAALRLFDEYAPSDALEDRDMYRHVKARFMLALALRGAGKAGRALFERDLSIVAPETARKRKEVA